MNLCRLELMKIKLSTYLWAILGIFFSMLALGVCFLFIYQIESGASGAPEDTELEMFANWNGLLALTTALAFSCYSVMSTVIAAKVVVSEYCGANAVVLLSYPVNRKEILRAKCLVVSGVTTVFTFISNTLVLGMMYISANIFGVKPHMHTGNFLFTVLISGFLTGILSSAVGIISTAVGWKKRSAVAAIVCSLVIVCAFANCITISPRNIVWVMLAISMVFAIIAAFVYHVLANGIEKMEV